MASITWLSEVTDIGKAVAFYEDVFDLKKLDEGEGDAFFKIGAHQFLALFEAPIMKPDRIRHFGLMVRDEEQIRTVRQELQEVRVCANPRLPVRFSRPVWQSHTGGRSALNSQLFVF